MSYCIVDKATYLEQYADLHPHARCNTGDPDTATEYVLSCVGEMSKAEVQAYIYQHWPASMTNP